MKRGATLTSAAVLLFLSACARGAPTLSPEGGVAASGGFTATFHASGAGPEGRIRLRGLLAVSGGDRLRIEIPGPTGGSGFFLVAGPSEVTALLATERLYYRGSTEVPILRELLGLDLETRQISRLLAGETARLGGSCSASMRRWSALQGDGHVPSKIRIDCGRGRLRLRLKEIRPLPDGAKHSAFEPIPLPEGYERTDIRGLAETLRTARRGSS
jgi:hypothetical protein